jgi:hypothetical protein
MITLIVDLGDPVVAKILLRARAPLLDIGQNRVLLQFDNVRGGVGEARGISGSPFAPTLGE